MIVDVQVSILYLCDRNAKSNNIMKLLLAMLPLVGGSMEEVPQVEADTTVQKHIEVAEVVVLKNPKQHVGLHYQPISSTVVHQSQMERERVFSVKDLSAVVPNFYQPDYGSKMTSSIYVRGFGTRIDQPVIGMLVDGMPYLNKNNYDFDMLDVQRVEFLRGPQSTLYGRNTMGGQMNVYTLSPLLYQGARASIEYSTGNTWRMKASVYGKVSDRFAFSLAGYYNSTDGHFKNLTTGKNCDWGESSGGRLRTIWTLGRGWEIDNVASVSYTNEGGYAYGLYDEQTRQQSLPSYNSPTSYERLMVSDGLSVEHLGERVHFFSTTSYQFTHDKMNIDNDFTPASFFTLIQEQHEHAFSEDLVLRSAESWRPYQWIVGAYGFYKKIDMAAPVSFMEDGISNLILGKMPQQMKSFLKVNPFDIESNFDIPTYGLALYHESSYRAGERWRFTVGLRLDYEKTTMDYDNLAAVDYKFDMSSMNPNIPVLNRTVEVPFKGRESLDFLELLPKFAVNYTTGVGDVYATVTRGYKAGGFNTQIFSDILQNKMKTALMADAMSAMGGGGMPGGAPSGQPSTSAPQQPAGGAAYDEASVTTYDPEYSWSYEVGTHLKFIEGRILLDVSAFWIECRDQQLTVFPEGTTTGRMMSNAGKSRSRGVEASLQWRTQWGLQLSGAYGYTNAKFTEYNDGKADYSGKYLPYAPQHTASASASYTIAVNGKLLDAIVLGVNYRGAGRIYWDEMNTKDHCQDYYSLLGASVELRKGDFSLSLWGQNLTDTKFNTFYFKSVENSFFSHGKPRILGVTLSYAM